jgi:hypothetical protein
MKPCKRVLVYGTMMSSAYELSVRDLQCTSSDVQGGIGSQQTERIVTRRRVVSRNV